MDEKMRETGKKREKTRNAAVCLNVKRMMEIWKTMFSLVDLKV